MRRVDCTTGRQWQPGPGAVLCSLHFHPDDYMMQWGRKLLKQDAVPTVFSFAPAAARRKLPATRLTAPEVTVSTSSNESNNNNASNSSQAQSSVQSVVVDHSYAAGSPTKLQQRNMKLLKQIQIKTAELRNARRRETRLLGKVADVLVQLRRKNLINSQAEEILEAYKHIPP